MRRAVLMFGIALSAFVLASHGAVAAPVKLTKQQVQTVCNGGSSCIKNCGLEGAETCGFKCDKKGNCSGSCISCGAKTRSQLFPNLHSKRVVKKAVKAP